MPDIENTDLGWLIQFLGRVNTLGKRGMRAALASQPRCRLGMLEHLHFQIEQSGQDGSIYVSELARAMRQPMPAVSRGCACSSRTAISCVRPTPMTAAKRSCASPRKGSRPALRGSRPSAATFPALWRG